MAANPPRDPATLLAQAGRAIDPVTGAVVPPIHPSVTFARDADYALIGPHLYGRYGNPVFDEVERLAARLEGGAGARLFSSGLAAIAAVFETVRAGRHIVAPKVMYFGAQAWLTRLCERRGIALDLVDAAEPGAIEGAVRPGETEIVWIETPANPTLDIVDIAAAAGVAHGAGAVLAVDGTCAPPVTTRALDLGADLVVHAATKYLNGHSDVLAGLAVTARDDERWREIQDIRRLSGAVAGPFEAWLLIRGMRTLALRYARASETALAIARHLEGHAKVERVLYPGLAGHPGHEVATRQMTGGFGGMLSIVVRGGFDAARRAVTALEVFVPATSLGGVESLVEHRRVVEGPDSTVDPGLLRLSIGIEAADDLLTDLEQALGRA